MTMVFSPSQDGLSAMILAWDVMSCGESCGSSLGCVWIQPKGSISLRYSCCGMALGKWTVWCVPHWGTITMLRISFTWGGKGSAWKINKDRRRQWLYGLRCTIESFSNTTEMWRGGFPPKLTLPHGASGMMCHINACYRYRSFHCHFKKYADWMSYHQLFHSLYSFCRRCNAYCSDAWCFTENDQCLRCLLLEILPQIQCW